MKAIPKDASLLKNQGQLRITIRTPETEEWTSQFSADQIVKKLLQSAFDHFGMTPVPGTIRLYDGRTLDENKTLKEEGVNNDAILILETKAQMKSKVVIVLLVYLSILGLFAIYLVLGAWPAQSTVITGNLTSQMKNVTQTPMLYGGRLGLPRTDGESTLFLIAISSGLVGAVAHSMASLVGHKAKADLGQQWVAWYVTRPPLGVGLALLFYFLMRGGLLTLGTVTLSTGATTVNPFAVAAISAIVGMFTDEATKRIGKLADTLFGVEEPREQQKNEGTQS